MGNPKIHRDRETVFVKVSTDKNDTKTIYDIISALRAQFGMQNVIFNQPLRNRGKGFHCFVNVLLPSSGLEERDIATY